MRTWDELSARAGRNDLPYILAMAVLGHGTLTDLKEIAIGIQNAWTLAEWPEQAIDRDIWLTLFQTSGFLFNELSITPPSHPINLYRGAVPKYRIGMSWTDDLERAEWFAHRFDGMRGTISGRVYTVTAPHEAILAHFTEARGENEWVLDANRVARRIRLLHA